MRFREGDIVRVIDERIEYEKLTNQSKDGFNRWKIIEYIRTNKSSEDVYLIENIETKNQYSYTERFFQLDKKIIREEKLTSLLDE